jgi:hypothetical protein
MSYAPAQADSARPPRAQIDHSLEIRRLARNVQTLIAAHPKTMPLGRDDLVEHLADTHGLGRFDVSIHRVCVGSQIRTLICVPERIARHAQSRAMLIALKHAAADAGHRSVLVHERFVQRQPRLSNMRLIEHAQDIAVRAEDRMAILMHLVEHGYSTIIDCAGVVSHASPIALVLHLVADGVLSIRTDKPIGPNTRVDLVEAGAS